jgi:alkylated DNA nucleotide flippase Atl1/2'-5' RNA ligase
MKIQKHLYNFLKLIPQDKVVSYGTLANIFCVSPREIGTLISQNKEQDIYPCYKVVNADGTVGGYNLGEEQKRKRLEADGVPFDHDRIWQEAYWRPRLRNIFVGIPFSESEKEKFDEVVHDIEQAIGKSDIDHAEITFPDTSTLHVTLRFFGSLHIKDFQQYVYAIDDHRDAFKRFLPKAELLRDNLNNFQERVFFLEDSNQQRNKELTSLYEEFHRILWCSLEERPFHAHFTLYRMRNFLAPLQEKLADFIEGISFRTQVDKITRYAAVEQHLQVPLIDIEF